MSYTFDGTTLVDPGPLQPLKSADTFEITIECQTEDMADITALAAKAGDFRQTKLISGKTRIQTTGTVGTLVLGGDSYTNCSIDGGVHVKEVEGSGGLIWKYTVKFVRDTSA